MIPSGPHPDPARRVAFPVRVLSEANRAGSDTCAPTGNALRTMGQVCFQVLRYHDVRVAAPVRKRWTLAESTD
jgi:hypothetical protein